MNSFNDKRKIVFINDTDNNNLIFSIDPVSVPEADPNLLPGDHVITGTGDYMCVSGKIYDIPNNTIIYKLVYSYAEKEGKNG